jgi:hypothetical protein
MWTAIPALWDRRSTSNPWRSIPVMMAPMPVHEPSHRLSATNSGGTWFQLEPREAQSGEEQGAAA